MAGIKTTADGVFGKLYWWLHCVKGKKHVRFLSDGKTPKDCADSIAKKLCPKWNSKKRPKDFKVISVKRALASNAGMFAAKMQGSTVYVTRTILTLED